ncbi:MAG: hypothetical protein QOK38_2391 [Acidobacteriaceae bacterium]|jgi:hypothetical protein|nr:hypothetical protein [Acidobacteriaceae bacterium]
MTVQKIERTVQNIEQIYRSDGEDAIRQKPYLSIVRNPFCFCCQLAYDVLYSASERGRVKANRLNHSFSK